MHLLFYRLRDIASYLLQVASFPRIYGVSEVYHQCRLFQTFAKNVPVRWMLLCIQRVRGS